MADIGKYIAMRKEQIIAERQTIHQPSRPKSLDELFHLNDMPKMMAAPQNVNTANQVDTLVTLIGIDRLRPYSRHPFKAYDNDKLGDLARSIEYNGLQQPIIVRVVGGIEGYEILAGHNRVAAVKRLGKQVIPAIIRVLDDNQAALVAVDTNLEQREKLLPSEKAFAYKLQLEALQNRRKWETQGGQIVHFGKSRDSIAKDGEETGRNIQRYIRLTQLIPELLNLIDQEQVPVMAGYEISFLDTEAQKKVWRYFFGDASEDELSLKNAKVIREAYLSGKPITKNSIFDILYNKPETNSVDSADSTDNREEKYVPCAPPAAHPTPKPAKSARKMPEEAENSTRRHIAELKDPNIDRTYTAWHYLQEFRAFAQRFIRDLEGHDNEPYKSLDDDEREELLGYINAMVKALEIRRGLVMGSKFERNALQEDQGEISPANAVARQKYGA